MVTANFANQLELKNQIERTIVVIEDYARLIDGRDKDIQAEKATVETLQTRVNDPNRRNMSSMRATIMVGLLVAVFVIDYILFYPVIGFLITFAFTGTPEGFWLEAARVIIPIAYLVIELNVAYFRGQERSPLGALLWILGSIIFGATVPVALAATFFAAFVNPLTAELSGISLDPRVFWLLLFFLVALAAMSHYGVIFRGEPIVLALQISQERRDLGAAEGRLKDLENEQVSTGDAIIQNYVPYRLLVHSYLKYDGGAPFNTFSQFSGTTVRVLEAQFEGDISYFKGDCPLFDQAASETPNSRT